MSSKVYLRLMWSFSGLFLFFGGRKPDLCCFLEPFWEPSFEPGLELSEFLSEPSCDPEKDLSEPALELFLDPGSEFPLEPSSDPERDPESSSDPLWEPSTISGLGSPGEEGGNSLSNCGYKLLTTGRRLEGDTPDSWCIGEPGRFVGEWPFILETMSSRLSLRAFFAGLGPDFIGPPGLFWSFWGDCKPIIASTAGAAVAGVVVVAVAGAGGAAEGVTVAGVVVVAVVVVAVAGAGGAAEGVTVAGVVVVAVVVVAVAAAATM